FCRCCGHKRADLGKDLYQGDLPKDRGLTSHIGPGYYQQAIGRIIKVNIVRDELVFDRGLHNRMAAVFDLDLIAVMQERANIIMLTGYRSKGTERVKVGQGASGCLKPFRLLANSRANDLKLFCLYLYYLLLGSEHFAFPFL